MTAAHEPKIAALMALHEGVLSVRGRARIERHVASCAACRRALAAIALYERTAEEIREREVPELDWSKMELALAREARAVSSAALGSAAAGAAPSSSATSASTSSGAKSASASSGAKSAGAPSGAKGTTSSNADPRPVPWALFAAAAAVLLLFGLWAWPGAGPEVATPERPVAPVAPRDAPPDPPVVAEPAVLAASITLVAGHVSARDAEGERAVSAGDALAEGTTLVAAASSEVHVRIASATGTVLRADSDARFARLREGDVEVALERGRLASTIDGEAFAAESRFVVMAAEHRFEGRATRYEIELDAPTGLLRLRVADGEVAVHRPDGRVNVVSAPGSWSNEGEASGGEVATPHGIGDESLDWPVLRVSHPDVVRWEIGEVAVAGLGELGMRVGPGEIAVAGFDEGGRAFRTVADVGGDGLTIDATGLVPEAPRVRADGYLPQEDIVEVVTAGQMRLRQCYSRALLQNPNFQAEVGSLQITIGLDGSVSRAVVRGGNWPDELTSCVRNYAERWSFPPPRGGTVQFAVPVRLQPAGARGSSD